MKMFMNGRIMEKDSFACLKIIRILHSFILRILIKRNAFNEQVCYILGYNCMKEKMLYKIA